MTANAQLVKFAVCCIILYIVVCSISMQWKRHLRRTTLIPMGDNNRSREICQRITTLPYSEPAPLERNTEYNQMRGGSIDLQGVSAMLKRVSDTCAKYNLTTPLTEKHFLYNSEHKSLYCRIRKIASNSFTKLYTDMKDRQAANDCNKDIQVLASESADILEQLRSQKEVFKLLIVRHPFERLVSSYRDRLEDNRKYTAQAWIYARKIFRLTRPELFRSNATTGTFLQRVFTSHKRLKLVPTFKEFIKWLLLQSPSQDDVHWDFYYTHCAVCNISYNFILKLDNYSTTQVQYVISSLGMDKSKSYLPTLHQNDAGYTDAFETCKYLRSLSRNTLLQLYDRYKIDFEMYNYDLEKYISCANGTFHVR